MPRRPDGCNRNQRLLLKRSQIAENIPDKILKSNLLAEDKIIFMERGRQPAPGFCRWGYGIAVKPDIDPVVKGAVLKTAVAFKSNEK